MSYADPQSFTITGGTATSLPRTSSGVNSGEFTSADSSLKLSVSHSNGKRKRHMIRIDHSKIAADPFNTGLNESFSGSAYLVVDQPLVGYTQAELQAIVTGFTTFLTASSNAAIVKLLGGEN